jgi:hypothetical protein
LPVISDICAHTHVVAITAASTQDVYPRPDIAYRTIVDIEPANVELIVPNHSTDALLDALTRAARIVFDQSSSTSDAQPGGMLP